MLRAFVDIRIDVRNVRDFQIEQPAPAVPQHAAHDNHGRILIDRGSTSAHQQQHQARRASTAQDRRYCEREHALVLPTRSARRSRRASSRPRWRLKAHRCDSSSSERRDAREAQHGGHDSSSRQRLPCICHRRCAGRPVHSPSRARRRGGWLTSSSSRPAIDVSRSAFRRLSSA